MEPIIIEKTIHYKGGVFKVNNKNQWKILVFGTSGPGQNPHYFYTPIKIEKIPNELLIKSKGG